MSGEIKVIQTYHLGYHFRSRLEARWAVFFDALGIKWEYEKEGYDLGSLGWYLPDFYLPTLDCFIEIKGKKATEIEQNKCGRLSSISPVFLFDEGLGEGLRGWYSDGATPSATEYRNGAFHDYPMKFLKCDKCGSVNITFDGWVHYSGCKCYNDKHRNKGGAFHPDVLSAFAKAKSARFEHGESGAT